MVLMYVMWRTSPASLITHCSGLQLFRPCLLKVCVWWQCRSLKRVRVKILESFSFSDCTAKRGQNCSGGFHCSSQLRRCSTVTVSLAGDTVPLCAAQGWRVQGPGPGLWCNELGALFGCLGRSWDRRGQSVMEWLLCSLLSCLPWHECPSSSILKGTLLAKGEWDILATDPEVEVKGNSGGRWKGT